MFRLQTKIDDLVLRNKSKRRRDRSEIREFDLERLIYLGQRVTSYTAHTQAISIPININLSICKKTKVL